MIKFIQLSLLDKYFFSFWKKVACFHVKFSKSNEGTSVFVFCCTNFTLGSWLIEFKDSWKNKCIQILTSIYI